MEHLIMGGSPHVMFSELNDQFETPDDPFVFGSFNTSWAVYVYDVDTTEEKSDPSFVEWTAYVKEVNASGKFYTYFEMHKCDEIDFKHFYPPSKHIN